MKYNKEPKEKHPIERFSAIYSLIIIFCLLETLIKLCIQKFFGNNEDSPMAPFIIKISLVIFFLFIFQIGKKFSNFGTSKEPLFKEGLIIFSVLGLLVSQCEIDILAYSHKENEIPEYLVVSYFEGLKVSFILIISSSFFAFFITKLIVIISVMTFISLRYSLIRGVNIYHLIMVCLHLILWLSVFLKCRTPIKKGSSSAQGSTNFIGSKKRVSIISRSKDNIFVKSNDSFKVKLDQKIKSSFQNSFDSRKLGPMLEFPPHSGESDSQESNLLELLSEKNKVVFAIEKVDELKIVWKNSRFLEMFSEDSEKNVSALLSQIILKRCIKSFKSLIGIIFKDTTHLTHDTQSVQRESIDIVEELFNKVGKSDLDNEAKGNSLENLVLEAFEALTLNENKIFSVKECTTFLKETKFEFLWKENTKILSIGILKQSSDSNPQIIIQIDEVPLKTQIKILEKSNLNSMKILNLASNDIRTPLNCINTMLVTLFDDIDNEKSEMYLAPAINALKYALIIVNALVDMAQLEIGNFKMVCIEFDLKMFLTDALSMISIQCNQRGVELKLLWDENIPSVVKTDPNRLRQIVIHLLSNSLKFTMKGSITLKAKLVKKKNLISISVIDTGIGMKQEVIDFFVKSFDNMKTKDALEGSISQNIGLGLMISDLLARNINNNQNEGITAKPVENGTCFKFKFKNLLKTSKNEIQASSISKEAEIEEVHVAPESDAIKLISNLNNSSKGKTAPKAHLGKIYSPPKHEFPKKYLTSIADGLGSKCYDEKPNKLRRNSTIQFDFKREIIEFKTNNFADIKSDLYFNSGPFSDEKYFSIDPIKINSNYIMSNTRDKKCGCADILICDDDDFNIMALRVMLKGLNLVIDHTYRGETAFDKIESRFLKKSCCRSFNVIFMDIEMPGLNGWDTSKKIREFYSSQKQIMPIVIGVTNESFQKDNPDYVLSGMVDCLTKPLMKNAIIHILKEYLKF